MSNGVNNNSNELEDYSIYYFTFKPKRARELVLYYENFKNIAVYI